MTVNLTRLKDLLIKLEEAYDGRADADIFVDGPLPNFEMRCLMLVRECLEIIGNPNDVSEREFQEYIKNGAPF